jgi:hypothetical protein
MIILTSIILQNDHPIKWHSAYNYFNEWKT